jgi:uncharacterized glyoxalase superfamily protein PhnB
MASLATKTRATVIPCLRYRDAPAAIEWLCRALGFEKHLVVPNQDGTIAHAQLSLGQRSGQATIASRTRWTDSEGGRHIPAAAKP